MKLLDLFCGAGGAAMGRETELAWAAGFFDGEGSISPRFDKRPGRNPLLQLSIEQNDHRPLERFVAAVGRGKVLMRASVRPGANKPMHRVAFGHESTIAVLRLLWPYLSEPKKEQADRAYRRIIHAEAA